MNIKINQFVMLGKVLELFSFNKSFYHFAFLCLLFIFANPLISQNAADTGIQKITTANYIAKVDTVISVKLNLNTEFEQFLQTVNDETFDIRPNITLGAKLAFSYRFISFGIGFKPQFIPGNNDNDMQGKTRTFSFGVNIVTKHWMQEL